MKILVTGSDECAHPEGSQEILHNATYDGTEYNSVTTCTYCGRVWTE